MKKQFSGEKIFQIFDITLMCIFMVLVLIPVFTVLMTSFVSEAEIAQRGTFIIIPQKFDFSAYKMLLASFFKLIIYHYAGLWSIPKELKRPQSVHCLCLFYYVFLRWPDSDFYSG